MSGPGSILDEAKAGVRRLTAAVRAHREEECDQAPMCPGRPALRLLHGASPHTVFCWLVAACNMLADHDDEEAARDVRRGELWDSLLPLVAEQLAAHADEARDDPA